MMEELFSEVYSRYYQAAAKILRAAKASPLTRAEIATMVEENAFAESGLYLLPRLLDGEWPLLKRDGDRYGADLAVPKLPLTKLQKSWLRAVLQDPRIRLFLKEPQLQALDGALSDIPPLFYQKDFYTFDVNADGDPYEDSAYQERFRILLSAVREKRILCVTAVSPKNKRPFRGDYLPGKLEYSSKDDKFRLYAALVSGGRFQRFHVLNLGRITEIRPSRERYAGEVDWDGYFLERRCKEPVRLKILPQRNAVERCMLHFASYEKRTEYDETTGSYLCDVYYDQNDESELLIRVLSFGPVVQVLGPEPFLAQIRERVERQYALLYDLESSGI